MQRNEIFEKLKELLGTIDDEIDTSVLSESSRLKEEAGLSSVAMLYMAVSLENEFGIDLTEVKIEELLTVGDVVSFLEQSMKAGKKA